MIAKKGVKKMKFVYFDASAGLSGDMILAALLDLGIEPALFKKKMGRLGLPVDIRVRETRRSSLRALKIDVLVEAKKGVERNLREINGLIRKSSFSPEVKKNSLTIFERLFEAEAKVHGRKLEEAHLHEAGADDALVDIVGTCFLAEALSINRFYCSPLNLGGGSVKSSHGLLPVPPPAVAELVKGVPVYSAGAREELVTPTGAAIVTSLVEKFLSFPEIIYQRIGCGAGSRDFPGFPNVLRAFCGEAADFEPDKRVYLIEATIDDSTPQLLAHFIETALERGALDAYLTPVVMKKNRLGTQLTILAGIDKIEELIVAIFRETSSIGVRYYPVERRVLPREIRKVKVGGTSVGIKVSFLDGREVNAQPEYEDCLKVAGRTGLPLMEVIKQAAETYRTKFTQKSGRRRGSGE
jgi:uncharacterized protein (TIGR00299 family) protein